MRLFYECTTFISGSCNVMNVDAETSHIVPTLLNICFTCIILFISGHFVSLLYLVSLSLFGFSRSPLCFGLLSAKSICFTCRWTQAQSLAFIYRAGNTPPCLEPWRAAANQCADYRAQWPFSVSGRILYSFPHPYIP